MNKELLFDEKKFSLKDMNLLHVKTPQEEFPKKNS